MSASDGGGGVCVAKKSEMSASVFGMAMESFLDGAIVVPPTTPYSFAGLATF